MQQEQGKEEAAGTGATWMHLQGVLLGEKN
jgi:hypothetical protein